MTGSGGRSSRANKSKYYDRSQPAEILRGRERNEERERRGRLAERPLPVGGEANRASHWLKVLQCIEFWRDPPQSHATSPQLPAGCRRNHRTCS